MIDLDKIEFLLTKSTHEYNEYLKEALEGTVLEMYQLLKDYNGNKDSFNVLKYSFIGSIFDLLSNKLEIVGYTNLEAFQKRVNEIDLSVTEL